MQTRHWPQKIFRFKITCPLQRMLVAKYESNIDWNGSAHGLRIKCPDSLDAYVEEYMLPSLRAKMDPRSVENNFCFEVRAIDKLLSAQGPLMENAREIQINSGSSAAREFLIYQINKAKEAGFLNWWFYLTRDNELYRQHPAFQYLVFRPVLESSNKNCTKPPVCLDAESLALLFQGILDGTIEPNQKVLEVYCSFLTQVKNIQTQSAQAESISWIHLCKSSFRAAKQLSALSLGTGWCVAAQQLAIHYLRDSDFHILKNHSRGCVALRVVADRCIEIQGRGNQSPSEWWPHVMLYCSARGFKIIHRQDEAHAVRTNAESLMNGALPEFFEALKENPFLVQFIKKHRTNDHDLMVLQRDSWLHCIKYNPWSSHLAPKWVQMDETFQRSLVLAWSSVLDEDINLRTNCPTHILNDESIISKWASLLMESPYRAIKFSNQLLEFTPLRSLLKSAWTKQITRFPDQWRLCPPEIQLEVLFALSDKIDEHRRDPQDQF